MSTALYRRYRPETFADVIGQEHVTEPLMAALAADRITHAYLFSGPRGCGKTTSARILARCLNCAQGPTAHPCGTCDSCLDLARGGPGSLDVVEIDAASHNGVDDARELRERAAFAPARDRYKIFILDEAHMVTTQGFNALLKLVEEPPPHIKFVFATTEPDKVIGTIRSRTHHYPFRLVAPEKLTEYLQSLAKAEGAQVAGGVLPLVVRAGGGSVRDSLSVLDQLIAGSHEEGLTYERAVALLGFTHSALLDDAIDALAARDGLSLFRVVDRVIESGHAPRRFVEDLLERLRDLIVVRAAGDEAAAVLRSVPADQLERMRTQAQHMGAAALSRTADLVNDGLTDMTGATSPRLQLELLCARLLLPAADDGVDGFAARLDRLEAALAGAPAPVITSGTASPAADGVEATPHAAARPASATAAASAAGALAASAHVGGEGPQPVTTSRPSPQSAPAGDGGNAASGPAETAEGSPAPVAEEPSGSTPGESAAAGPVMQELAAAAPAQPAAGPEAGAMTTDQVRRRWPEVLETLARLKRTTWALVSQDAQVMNLSATSLALGFSTSGLATAFRSGPHGEVVAQALRETLGVEVRIEPVLNDGSASAPAGTPGAAAPAGTPGAAGPDGSPGGGRSHGEAPGDRSSGHAEAPGQATAGAARGQSADPVPVRSDESADSGQPGGLATHVGDGWADIPVRQPPREPEPPAAHSREGAQPSGPHDPQTGPGSGVTSRAPSAASPTGSASGPGGSTAGPGGSGTGPGQPVANSQGAQVSATSGSPAHATGPAPAHADRDQGGAGGPGPDEALVAEPPRTSSTPAPVQRLGEELDEHSPDDPDLEHTEVVGAPLVARLLGGTVIDEEIDDSGQVN